MGVFFTVRSLVYKNPSSHRPAFLDLQKNLCSRPNECTTPEGQERRGNGKDSRRERGIRDENRGWSRGGRCRGRPWLSDPSLKPSTPRFSPASDSVFGCVSLFSAFASDGRSYGLDMGLDRRRALLVLFQWVKVIVNVNVTVEMIRVCWVWIPAEGIESYVLWWE